MYDLIFANEFSKFIYFRWINENKNKIWDAQPTCRGPGGLGGATLQEMNFDSLCDGQWASMLNLAPRVRVKSNLSKANATSN